MKIWVIIPAYNENVSLADILIKLKEKEFRVLVVDDGSSDNTYEVARKQADLVIRNKKNLGKGKSLNKGIDFLLKKNNFDYVITMDGDGQHSPLDIDQFVLKAQSGSDLVVGNRMVNPLEMPRVRFITNRFMSWFISKIVGQDIPDTQCGYRLIKRNVLKKIIIESNKFEIESEIIIKAAKLGFSVESIPIKSIYFRNPSSKIHPFIDTLRFLRFVIQTKG